MTQLLFYTVFLLSVVKANQFTYYMGHVDPPSNLLSTQSLTPTSLDGQTSGLTVTLDKAINKFSLSAQAQPYYLKVEIV